MDAVQEALEYMFYLALDSGVEPKGTPEDAAEFLSILCLKEECNVR